MSWLGQYEPIGPLGTLKEEKAIGSSSLWLGLSKKKKKKIKKRTSQRQSEPSAIQSLAAFVWALTVFGRNGSVSWQQLFHSHTVSTLGLLGFHRAIKRPKETLGFSKAGLQQPARAVAATNVYHVVRLEDIITSHGQDESKQPKGLCTIPASFVLSWGRIIYSV